MTPLTLAAGGFAIHHRMVRTGMIAGKARSAVFTPFRVSSSKIQTTLVAAGSNAADGVLVGHRYVAHRTRPLTHSAAGAFLGIIMPAPGPNTPLLEKRENGPCFQPRQRSYVYIFNIAFSASNPLGNLTDPDFGSR